MFKFDEQQEINKGVFYKYKQNGLFEKVLNFLKTVDSSEINSIELDKLDYNSDWFETKNSEWIKIEIDGFFVLLRKYHLHFTMYVFRKYEDEQEEMIKNIHGTSIGIYILKNNDESTPNDDEWYGDPSSDDRQWSLLRKVIRKTLKSALQSKFILGEEWIEVRKVYENEFIDSVDSFGFAMSELAYFQKCFMCEYTYKEFLLEKSKIDIVLSIPSKYGSYDYISLNIDENGIPFFTKKDRKSKETSRIYMWSTLHWDYERIYNSLKWIHSE